METSELDNYKLAVNGVPMTYNPDDGTISRDEDYEFSMFYFLYESIGNVIDFYPIVSDPRYQYSPHPTMDLFAANLHVDEWGFFVHNDGKRIPVLPENCICVGWGMHDEDPVEISLLIE